VCRTREEIPVHVAFLVIALSYLLSDLPRNFRDACSAFAHDHAKHAMCQPQSAKTALLCGFISDFAQRIRALKRKLHDVALVHLGFIFRN